MSEALELVAPCGLYCGDCAGYSGEIADKAQALLEVLERYRFHRTARSLFAKQLADYDRTHEDIRFMAGLRCSKVCRLRGEGETPCAIRKCCLDRGYFACHECAEFEGCEKLKTLEGAHGDACIRNLVAMRDMGVEAWMRSGQRLWSGDSE